MALFQWLFRICLGLLALLAVNLAFAQVNSSDALSGSSNPAVVLPSNVSSYKLASGDVITIRVFGEDDFTKEKIRLNDAGTIMFPALGEVNVLGQTIGDLERLITNGLKGRILVDPKVSVQIEEYRPFYINGMVEKPGAYPFQPGMTVRKAASLAGGFKERASLNKIYIFRENDTAHHPEKADLNSIVGPGDSLTVEESFF
jgi:polysaccharide export outer membrane protein